LPQVFGSSPKVLPSRSTTLAMRGAALLLSLVVPSVATELTKESWDDAVAGKTVFIKFQAPW